MATARNLFLQLDLRHYSSFEKHWFDKSTIASAGLKSR